MKKKAPTSVLVRFIKHWRIRFAVMTVIFNLAALLLVVVVFPDVSNLWIAVLVLVTGLTGSLATVADLLVNAEESVKNDVERS